jgi:heterodisulfide reductase subunit A
MYAIKNAVLAKIHDEHIEPYVFYIDLRTYGKGFDEYARRAKEEYGVNFIRSKPAKITENPETKNLFIWYENTIDRKLERKEVDMVVLANAAIPRKNSGELAEILGVELDEYGFFKVKSDLYDSTTTTKPGIFVAGFAQFPKDITDSVIQGSAAASKASAVIS